MALVSFKQEIAAVRESLQGVTVDGDDVVSTKLMSKLDRVLHELASADEELARQGARFETVADELRLARTRHHILFESMPAPCIVTDIHGTVRVMNPAAVALIGTPLAVMGKPLLLRVPSAARNIVRERLAEASRGHSVSWEGQIGLGGQAEALDIAFTLAALASAGDGEIVEILWMLRDLSAQRRLEEHDRVLKARVQHLASSNQELEEFAHVVAHDLKEPLRGMRLTAGFIEEDTKGKIDGASTFRLKTIQTLCGRAMSMVDSVLESAKIAGAPMRMEAVLVSDLVADATQRLIATITEHQARVGCDEVACTTRVRCDRAQAARAMANLIANGIKYNESTEKRVVISVAPARNDGQEGESTQLVQLCINDNGIGIPADQTSAIFRMFSRLAPKDRDEGFMPATDGQGGGAATATAPAAALREGTGAGLAIVKKIIEKHGGRVWVEPGQRTGTSFCLTLPRA